MTSTWDFKHFMNLYDFMTYIYTYKNCDDFTNQPSAIPRVPIDSPRSHPRMGVFRQAQPVLIPFENLEVGQRYRATDP